MKSEYNDMISSKQRRNPKTHTTRTSIHTRGTPRTNTHLPVPSHHRAAESCIRREGGARRRAHAVNGVAMTRPPPSLLCDDAPTDERDCGGAIPSSPVFLRSPRAPHSEPVRGLRQVTRRNKRPKQGREFGSPHPRAPSATRLSERHHHFLR